MILVADSGSTKTDWVLTDETGFLRNLNTIGFNPLYHTADFIEAECKKVFDQEKMPYASVKEVYYYGASVWDEEKEEKVKNALKRLFPDALIDVEHDLLGHVHRRLPRLLPPLGRRPAWTPGTLGNPP